MNSAVTLVDIISWVDVVTWIVSIIALFISIISAFLQNRKIKTETISTNRIVWIEQMREKASQFITYYYNNDEKNMRITLHHMELYMNDLNSTYMSLISSGEKCFQDISYDKKHAKEFVRNAQIVLSLAWTRMKKEAGISQKQEVQINKELMAQFPTLTLASYEDNDNT